jgi:hypothetical protein
LGVKTALKEVIEGISIYYRIDVDCKRDARFGLQSLMLEWTDRRSWNSGSYSSIY